MVLNITCNVLCYSSIQILQKVKVKGMQYKLPWCELSVSLRNTSRYQDVLQKKVYTIPEGVRATTSAQWINYLWKNAAQTLTLRALRETSWSKVIVISCYEEKDLEAKKKNCVIVVQICRFCFGIYRLGVFNEHCHQLTSNKNAILVSPPLTSSCELTPGSGSQQVNEALFLLFECSWSVLLLYPGQLPHQSSIFLMQTQADCSRSHGRGPSPL